MAVGKITERSGRLLTERFVINKIITRTLPSTGVRSGDDAITLAGSGGGVTANRLSGVVTILGSEGANDRMTVNALGGNDIVDASGLGSGIIGLVGDGGDGDDNVVGSAGNDILLGGLGDDVLIGGPGLDLLDGGPGANVVIQD